MEKINKQCQGDYENEFKKYLTGVSSSPLRLFLWKLKSSIVISNKKIYNMLDASKLGTVSKHFLLLGTYVSSNSFLFAKKKKRCSTYTYIF